MLEYKYGTTIQLANIAHLFYNFIFRIPVWVTFLTLEKGISLERIALLLSIRYITSIILELPSGALADLIGRKWTVLIGYLITAITSILFIIFNSFESFIFMYILLGIYTSLISGSEEALIYDTLKENNQEKDFHKVSLQRISLLQYGIIIGTFSGGFLYFISPSLPFILEFIAAMISVIVFLFVKEPSIDSKKYTIKNYLKKFIDGYKDITRNRFIFVFSMTYAIISGITFAFQIFFNQALLVYFGYSTIAISLIFGIYRILNLGFLSKVVNSKSLFKFKYLILFFPFVMMTAYLPGIWTFKILAILIIGLSMIASTARSVFLNKFLNDNFTSKNRATSLSLVNLFLSLIYSLSTFISSIIGDIQMTFTVFGIFSLIIVLPLCLYILKLNTQDDILF